MALWVIRPLFAELFLPIVLIGASVLVLFGIVFGVVYGVVYAVAELIAITAAFGLSALLIYAPQLLVLLDPSLTGDALIKSAASGAANSGLIALPFGVATAVIRAIVSGPTSGTSSPVAVGLTVGLLLSLALGLLITLGVDFPLAGVPVDAPFAAGFAAGFGLIYVSAFMRIDAALTSVLLAPFGPARRWFISVQRVSPVAVPWLKRQLIADLEADWTAGLRQTEGLLRYSLQTAPVLGALRATIWTSPDDQLLRRVAEWCSMPLYSWDIVFALSKSPQTWRKLRTGRFLAGLWLLPDKLRPRIVNEPGYETDAQAACAAFWSLGQVIFRSSGGEATLYYELKNAVKGFALLCHLPYGEELYSNVITFDLAFSLIEREIDNIDEKERWIITRDREGDQIIVAPPGYREKVIFGDPSQIIAVTTGQPPDQVDNVLLRPQVRVALAKLGLAAQNIRLVLESRSRLQRSTALNQATGILNTLKDGLDDCPTPERPILQEIAAAWLELALDQASVIGSFEVRERVASPYTVGAVVAPERLIGRRDIFDLIQQIWDKPGNRDSLVIYGQRRVGKSSIVRAIDHFCQFSHETAVAVLNIQSVSWDHGLVDLCYQIGFALWRELPADFAEPQFEDFEQRPLISLRGLLVRLNQAHPERRYILILDEYEELEYNLPPENGREFVRMLRGWTQDFSWLAVALVGLHTLQERSSDYFAPIFAWRSIPVGLMDADAVADMLQVDDDAFPLSYSPDLLRTVHELTGGQPLLVQLIGDTLVEHFNRRLLDPGPPPESMLGADDLMQALTGNPRFEADSAIYFQGVWRQAADPLGQQTILRALAQRAGLAGPFFSLRSSPPTLTQAELYASAPIDELEAMSGLDPQAFTAALDSLKRHDIVSERDGNIRYTVELMRRWVAEGGPDAR
ncbi:MAG TPA: ATP-binding protein [Herpetosiphonaceae bacterium]